MTPEGGKPDRHVIAAKIPPRFRGRLPSPPAATVRAYGLVTDHLALLAAAESRKEQGLTTAPAGRGSAP